MATELPVALVLAGGAGARAGGPKGLVEHGGRTWLEHQLTALRGAGVARVVLVLGHHAERYFERLPWLAARPPQHPAVELAVVVNDDPAQGQFASLLAGARWLRATHAGAAFVLPVDVPVASRAVFLGLAAALVPPVLAAQPVYQGRGGHPVLLADELLARMLQLSATDQDARLDVQLRRLPTAELARVPVVDALVGANHNTHEELLAQMR